MIHVSDFHKSFARTPAVVGLSFDVQPGQILGLIGPNGAGKTTTMRAIAGIIPASHGTLAVAGHNVADESIQAKSQLAFVPDDPPLFHDLTVDDHLAFYASMYCVDGATETALQLLQQFELTDRRKTLAYDLSRGMRQKLAICCAYLHNPRAILFDEPLTGLDPRGIRTFKQSLRDRADAGAAVIISSHLLAMVEDFCTHVLILHQGRTQFLGDLSELRQRYQRAGSAETLEEIFFAATAPHSEVCA